MFVEVDVTAGSNSPMTVNRMFDVRAKPQRVSRVLAANPQGQDTWCDVTGWSAHGPCPALAAVAEDSGEGLLMLVYGGDEGIRLKPADCTEEWDLASARQWGEACLLLDQDVRLES
ncbi:MAG: hypothetical protein EXR54_05510 [Dehalococcoidia bacterium]|nr:hypothetical protein [Dehalococcoidia bacterium]MSQ17012.1 hypothetical protein [Dehalococcoidia bacterium]